MNAAMQKFHMTEGSMYTIKWRSVIDGNVESGEGNFTFLGRESMGKLELLPENKSQPLYLFPAEVLTSMPAEPIEDVWQYQERAPIYAVATADLWYWSTNFDAGCGPFTLFLDLIGYSDEEFGQPIYGPTVRNGENRITEWSQTLGYMELGKLADALHEYSDRPQDVRAWIDGLMAFDEA